MMWGYPGYWNWGGMLIMMLSSLLWVTLISVVIVLVVRRLGSHSASSMMGPSHAASAMDILEQRYARGEIDEATSQHMRDELQAEQLHVTPT